MFSTVVYLIHTAGWVFGCEMRERNDREDVASVLDVIVEPYPRMYLELRGWLN